VNAAGSPPQVDDPLWTADEVAAYLRVPLKTVRHWRHMGAGGPLGIRIGNHVRYRRSEVLACLREWQRTDPRSKSTAM
jgi:excisionase family DNA binding protein